ncbi:response regulator [Paenibacillus sp. TAB 01]|uniref:response regulator n=1 Tax=Paenibacillus sp. TAB 01 TaxID=3368988 RepID=UPI003751B652
MYKLLIVDDESVIREGIERMARKHCPVFESIYTAKDGEEALALALNYVPDVVITDIQMPRMGGLEFVEQLKCDNPDVVVLVISGYDDFEYAQKGLKLGVQDYLLKPVESDALAERLNQAVAELNRKQGLKRSLEDLQQQIAQSRTLYKERFYRQLVSGGLGSEAVDEQAKALGLQFQADYYGVALVKMRRKPEANRQETEVMAAALAEDLRGANGRIRMELHPFYMNDDELVLLLGYGGAAKDSCFKALDQYLMQLGHALQKTVQVDAKIAAGQLYAELHEAGASYQEAEEAMLYHFSLTSRVLVHYEEISTSIVPGVLQTDRLYDELLLQVKLLEREAAHHVIGQLFGYFASLSGTNPHWVKMSVMELAMKLIHLMEESGIGLGLFFQDKEYDPYLNIYQHQDAAALQGWMGQFVDKCLDEMAKGKEKKGVSYIEKVKAYLDNSLSDSSLSIADVAAKLYLSPNYLRQLFRQQTGESFVEYVTRIRMEKALELLRDPLLKIQDVAEKVGYEEQRYFSSCFKKYYQMTPTEYREAFAEGIV